MSSHGNCGNTAAATGPEHQTGILLLSLSLLLLWWWWTTGGGGGGEGGGGGGGGDPRVVSKPSLSDLSSSVLDGLS